MFYDEAMCEYCTGLILYEHDTDGPRKINGLNMCDDCFDKKMDELFTPAFAPAVIESDDALNKLIGAMMYPTASLHAGKSDFKRAMERGEKLCQRRYGSEHMSYVGNNVREQKCLVCEYIPKTTEPIMCLNEDGIHYYCRICGTDKLKARMLSDLALLADLAETGESH